MKILRVIPSVDPKGGGPMEAANKIDSELLGMGHHIELVTLDSPKENFISNYPVTVHALGPSTSSYRYNKKLTPWLKQHASRFDAVIIDGLWQYHSFGAWRALKKSKVPYFIFTHGMLGPWFKYTYPLKHLKKWLYWPWAEYRVLRDASAVLFTCNEERLLARKSFWLYSATEAVTGFGTSAPPTNSEKLSQSFLDSFPELKNKRIVLFLGRLHQIKGCDILVESFSRVASLDQSLHLVMAGPDQVGWTNTLKDQAVKLGVSERITWTGMIQGDSKWGAYFSSEVFCLPSHHENFGVVVAEALACGKPVLISNQVNIWREISDDSAGFVDDDTVDGTTRNLKRWLALNPGEYKELTTRSRGCFSQRFDIKSTAERLLKIVQGHKS